MSAQTAAVSAERVMKELGLKSRRAVQTLASKGRLERMVLPKAAHVPGKNPVAYTQESLDEEKRRRVSGEAFYPETKAEPPPYQPSPVSAAQSSQIEAFRGLAEFLANLNTKLLADGVPLAPAREFADDAYLTLAEAAAIVRMPASWLKEMIKAGRLPYERTSRNGVRVRRGDLRTLAARFVGDDVDRAMTGVR